MRNALRFALGRLASLEYQRAFGVGATKDELVLFYELLDSATNKAEVTLAQPILSRGYTSAELCALREFVQVANEAAEPIPMGSLSWADLIATSEWNAIRLAAQRTLDALGLNVTLQELIAHDNKGFE